MTAVGGSIENVNINGRTFAVAADAEINRKLGGYMNEVEANGDGTARLIKTVEPFSLEGLQVSIDDARGDHEFLQDVANTNDFVPVNVTYASGSIWQGNAQITGDLQHASKSTTATINLKGTGKLTRQ